MSAATDAGANGDANSGELASIVRRAPFADNPTVGVRGQQAQSRIMEAALQVFGEVGYHGCAVKRITELSGCSRVSFYQYFSNKEDLFRHLAGHVAHQLTNSIEDLAPITGDQAGWDALRDWLEAFTEIYDRYEPVFVAFQSAAASDAEVASGASRIGQRTFTGVRAKIHGSALSSKQVDQTVRILLESNTRANRMSALLEAAFPIASGRSPRARLNEALADVFHRSLFGPLPGINVHDAPRRRRPRAATSVEVPSAPDRIDTLGPAALRTRNHLIETGLVVFTERGYYATRVVDIVKAAGVSHGVFYRYFDSKADLFHLLAARARTRLEEVLGDLPPIDTDLEDERSPAALRAWLRGYAGAYAGEASIISMWIEAMSYGDDMGLESATAIERSRAILATFLRHRTFGDPDVEAIVAVVLLDAMTSAPARLESFAQLIERGLLHRRAIGAQPPGPG